MQETVDRPTRVSDPKPTTFDAWYRATWPGLVAYLRVVLRDGHDAEDVATDALVKAFQRWDDGSLDSPTTWVFTVATNAGRRRLGRLGRATPVADPPDRPDRRTAVGWDPDLVAAIRTLPNRQRTAIALRYVADLSQADIAAAMGVAPGTVAALLHQARTNLRQTLGGPDHG